MNNWKAKWICGQMTICLILLITQIAMTGKA
jgi:hypothetical protein